MEEKKFDFVKCYENDISTFANIQEFRQIHIHISNKIDFDKFKYNIMKLKIYKINRLYGYTEISFEYKLNNEDQDKKRIILDCRNLNIKSVQNKVLGINLNWDLCKTHEACSALGTPLVIELDDTSSEKLKENDMIILRIDYETTENSDAVQWLNSNQTNLKDYPFMFTQCEAILARTLLPCQVFIKKIKISFYLLIY
jgi:aminopeptidase N